MESQSILRNLVEFQKPTELSIPSVNPDPSNVFKERLDSYLNEKYLFFNTFNEIPNFINEIRINCTKARLWFADQYKKEIWNSHYTKIYFRGNKKSEIDDIFYFLFEDLIIYFDTQNSMVRFLFRNTPIEKVDTLISQIKKFKKRRVRINEASICLLVNTRRGIETREMKIAKPKLSINDNYNDDLQDIFPNILKRLSKKDDKGIILLHGKPGTGKTSFIRYLISSIKKNVIFLPPNMASALTNPDFLPILIENPNSIFVIEDAENIVVDREKNGSSPVSAILNISDGLLSDCLNVQIICSFNTDLSRIDSALLRKGRLIAKYEFKELETTKAQSLSQKLGYNSVINSPMTLSAIYNQDDKDFQQVKKANSVGFKL